VVVIASDARSPSDAHRGIVRDEEVAIAVLAVSMNAIFRRFRIIRAHPFSNLDWKGTQTNLALPMSYPEPDGEF
jgi:hypothetical protein